jgi:hypothetical protein
MGLRKEEEGKRDTKVKRYYEACGKEMKLGTNTSV